MLVAQGGHPGVAVDVKGNPYVIGNQTHGSSANRHAYCFVRIEGIWRTGFKIPDSVGYSSNNRPAMDSDSQGFIHFLMRRKTASGSKFRYYGKISGTSVVQPATTVATNQSFDGFHDIASSPSGDKIHFSWANSSAGQYYRLLDNGQFSKPVRLGSKNFSAGVAIDQQGQAYVLKSVGEGTGAFRADLFLGRIENNSFVDEELIDALGSPVGGGTLSSIAIDKLGNRYVCYYGKISKKVHFRIFDQTKGSWLERQDLEGERPGERSRAIVRAHTNWAATTVYLNGEVSVYIMRAGQGSLPPGPVVHAGEDQAVIDVNNNGSESVQLDGSATVSEVDIMTYQWKKGTTVLASGVNPILDLPVGTHEIDLCVTDTNGNKGTDSITIVVAPSPPPAPPSDLMAEAVANSQISLSWTDNSDTETNFEVERASGFGTLAVTLKDYKGSNRPPSMETAGTPQSFQGGALQANDRSDTFDRVPADLNGLTRLLCARNDKGDSGFNEMYVVNLSVPATVYAVVSPEYQGAPMPFMDSTWSATNLTAHTQPQYQEGEDFRVWKKEAPAGDLILGADDTNTRQGATYVFRAGAHWERIATLGANLKAFPDTGLAPGLTYSYRVRAVNSVGHSFWSNESFATTPSNNGMPQLKANAGSYSPVIDNDGNGFERLQLDGGASTPAETIVSYAWSEGEVALATGRNPSISLEVGAHTITLRVTDDKGTTDTDSITIIVHPSEVPSAPSNLEAVTASSSQINLGWTLSGTLSADFQVERSQNSGNLTVNLVAYRGNSTRPTVEWLGTAQSFKNGARQSNDRSDTFDRVPEQIKGLTRLLCARNDKRGPGSNSMYVVNLSAPATVYAVISPEYGNERMPFMDTSWTDTGFTAHTQPQYPQGPDFRIWKKDVPAGNLTLGADNNNQRQGATFVFKAAPIWALVATLDENSRTFQNSGLTPATMYHYRVRAVNAGGPSPWSTEASTKTFDSGVKPPIADAGSDQVVFDRDNSGIEIVTLNGRDSSSSGTIVSYVWKEADTEIGQGVNPSVQLTVGIHTIWLIVTDSVGLTASDTCVITVEKGESQEVILELRAVTVSSSQIDLDWASSVTDSKAIQIERLHDSGKLTVNLVGYRGINSPPTVEPGGTAQSFQVGARQANDRGDTFDRVPQKLAGLTRLFCARNDKSGPGSNNMYVVNLSRSATVYAVVSPEYGSSRMPFMDGSWTDTGLTAHTTPQYPDGTPFRIWKKDAPAGDLTLGADDDNQRQGAIYVFEAASIWAPVSTLSGTARAFSDTGLAENTSYSYRVRVNKNGGASVLSNEVTISTNSTPPPLAVPPSPPVAKAGPDQTVTDNDGDRFESVALDGSGSTSESSIISYAWTQGTTGLATGVNPTVSLPVGIHVITLTVVDNQGAQSSDNLIVTVTAKAALRDLQTLGTATAVTPRGRSDSDKYLPSGGINGTSSGDQNATNVSWWGGGDEEWLFVVDFGSGRKAEGVGQIEVVWVNENKGMTKFQSPHPYTVEYADVWDGTYSRWNGVVAATVVAPTANHNQRADFSSFDARYVAFKFPKPNDGNHSGHWVSEFFIRGVRVTSA